LPPVPVDDAQIERVVANLVENAARYSPAGSPIGISAMRVGGEVELKVEGEGSGISACEQERVFEKFYRGTGAGSGVGGTGLGLAICRGIVEAHGCSIRATNRPDGGACLTVRLPLAIQAIEAHQ
jgi:two-component system sensor histidine kinase KdpD